MNQENDTPAETDSIDETTPADVEATLNVDDGNVIDDAARDTVVVSQRYDITSFGADYDAEGLYRRLERDEIFVPEFQRDYVWKLAEASRFIESLLLGLPVPGIFLAREPDTNRLLVIDGQQRLKTLQFFYNGYFNPKNDEKRRRVFSLTKVEPRFEGKTYSTLNPKDRITLDNSIIHATIVKQDAPADDDTSIYHIFERLNNGGRKLTPQEIRAALYHGTLIDTVNDLNDYANWRDIYGPTNNRLKDEELILRYLALYFGHETYVKPMGEFINRFCKKNKNAGTDMLGTCSRVFTAAINTMYSAIGTTAFRPERSLNAAVFDSVMVGISKRLDVGGPPEPESVRLAYLSLLQDAEYVAATIASTSDEKSVGLRIGKAIKAFLHV
jgi:hypothetical protein